MVCFPLLLLLYKNLVFVLMPSRTVYMAVA